MNIRMIGPIIYLIILVLYAVGTAWNNITVKDGVYYVGLLSIIGAYISGCIAGGAFG